MGRAGTGAEQADGPVCDAHAQTGEAYAAAKLYTDGDALSYVGTCHADAVTDRRDHSLSHGRTCHADAASDSDRRFNTDANIH